MLEIIKSFKIFYLFFEFQNEEPIWIYLLNTPILTMSSSSENENKHEPGWLRNCLYYETVVTETGHHHKLGKNGFELH